MLSRDVLAGSPASPAGAGEGGRQKLERVERVPISEWAQARL